MVLGCQDNFTLLHFFPIKVISPDFIQFSESLSMLCMPLCLNKGLISSNWAIMTIENDEEWKYQYPARGLNPQPLKDRFY